MASGSSHQSYQSPITCNICDGSDNVDSYCLMCKGPMCGACKASHTQTTMFRKHKIIPIVEELKHQVTEEDCSTHSSYTYSMYCNVCHKLVCSECISSEEHRHHDFGEIKAAVQRVQNEINEYHNSLKNIYLSQYRTQEEKITQVKADCKKVAMKVKSDINNKRAKLITEVHRVCDDLISEVDDEEKQKSLQIDQSLQKVQDTIKEIEQLMAQSKGALTKLPSELIKFNQEKPSLLHLDVQESPKIHPSTFVPATINREKVAEQIGKLVSKKHLLIDTSIIHKTMCDTGISLIKAVVGNQAWAKVYQENELRLVDTNGKVVKCINIKFSLQDFAFTTSGDIIVPDYNGTCIRIMTQTGQVTQTINTNPNKPTGVCLDNNKQEIVVCVNTSDETRCKLVVFSRDGKEIRTITYTDKPVGSTIIQTVKQNNRGDYCVVHWGHNKVYVVDTNGGLRWTYDGSGAGELQEDFGPRDICSDIYNHLIISDTCNNKIQMLDDKGNFLRFLLTEQDGITRPHGLYIDKDGRLWVGQQNGDLCVIKYLQ